jgi:hypothetical protein
MFLRTDRIPSRNRWWSSASNIFIGPEYGINKIQNKINLLVDVALEELSVNYESLNIVSPLK